MSTEISLFDPAALAVLKALRAARPPRPRPPPPVPLAFVHDDGGRAASGRKGKAGDCVCRSIAIASGRPYAEIYKALAAGTGAQRVGSYERAIGRKRAASASHGVNTTRKWFKTYMATLGATWTPAMQIGSGCQVHLRAGELPMAGWWSRSLATTPR